jgi:hypothetical protein
MTNSAHQSLTSALPKLRKRIQKIHNRNENIGEQNTKAALIDPLLAALGWDVEDIDEVSREYRRKSQDNPVDYALFMLRSPPGMASSDRRSRQRGLQSSLAHTVPI